MLYLPATLQSRAKEHIAVTLLYFGHEPETDMNTCTAHIFRSLFYLLVCDHLKRPSCRHFASQEINNISWYF